MPARTVIRKLVYGSFPATCAVTAARNFVEGVRFNFGNIATDSGTRHGDLSIADSIAYIESVHQDYKTYGQVARFHGRVAEVGPGDNCGVGMLMRLDGCPQVDLVDRFYSQRNAVQQARIYEGLIARHEGLRSPLDGSDLMDEGTFPGLRRFYGQSAAAEEFFGTHKGYDFIVSRAVGEHLYDPIAAMRDMVAALNAGGMLLHKVDLSDHGLFSIHHHELKWLEVPDWVYRRMSVGSGRPNRVLAHRYREFLALSNTKHSLLVTALAGVGKITPHLPYEDIDEELRQRAERYVESIRPNLARSLRDVSARDLAIAGIFVIARVP